jgi:hypothetical protein
MVWDRPSRPLPPDLADLLQGHNNSGPVSDAGRVPSPLVEAIGYAAVMSFSADDVALLDGVEEVEIETQAPDSAPRRTMIWVVVDDGEVFIRTYRGPGSRWYRDVLANPAVAIHVDGRRLPATAIPATDPDAIERTSAGYKRKYASDPATPAMLGPKVLETTLRLEPA